MVLEAEVKMKHQQTGCLAKPPSWLSDGCLLPLTPFSTGRRDKRALWVSFIRALIPFSVVLPSPRPNPPRPLRLNTITRERQRGSVEIPRYRFGEEHKYSVCSRGSNMSSDIRPRSQASVCRVLSAPLAPSKLRGTWETETGAC